MAVNITSDTIGKLRESLVSMKKKRMYLDIIEPKEEVLARFQPVFSVQNVAHISEDEFRSLLLFENNKHWTGLHRQGPRIFSDMKELRNALSALIDESRNIADRLDEAVKKVSGMGKNISTAILLITHPEKYGVWNNRSEANMKRLEIWPKFERGESFGNRYMKVNEILLQLKNTLKTDLWTLDILWWYLDQEEIEGGDEKPGPFESEQRFGLERHLHEFLRDNWNHVELSKEWEIYSEPGDDEYGYEYPCSVGRIDLLAKHKTKRRWLVIEL